MRLLTTSYLRLLLVVLVMLALPFSISAQRFRVLGQVFDMTNYEAIDKASIQLFSKDSIYLRGVHTDEKGHFNISIENKGDYHIAVSYLGMKTLMKDFSVAQRTTDLGALVLAPDTIMLDDAVVTANLPKMQVVADTLVFNAGAYKVPEGGVLDELIELLPGADVTEEGITINGKRIEKILLDGKEFFVGDMNTARKNIPVDIVDKLKVYDERSEMAKVTGIDDGVERPVIDIRVKKGMNIGYMADGDAGYGTRDRYTGRLTATSFTSRNKLAFVGNGSNLSGGRSTPSGRGGGGGGGQGLRTSQSLGLNYNYDDKGHNGRREAMLQMDGSVGWNHGTSNQETRQMSENWEKIGARTYSNSQNSTLSRSHGFNANYRLEWRPDEMTNIQFRPQWSYSNNDRMSYSVSMQFSDDPYAYTDNPLSLDRDFLDVDGIRTNRRENRSLSHTENKRVGGSLQYNRKFGDMGRNMNLRVEGNYNTTQSTDVSNNHVHLYKVKDRQGNDSVYYTNRYNLAPSTNWDYSVHVSYSEPLMRATFLQFSYNFRYNVSESDRSTYDFSGMREAFGSNVELQYGGFDGFLANVGDDIEKYLDTSKSRYSKYQNMNHDAQVLFRIIRTYYNFSTGLRWQPQRSHFIQDYLRNHTDTVRNVSNFNPTLNLQIKFSRRHTLKLDYHGNSSQPSITQLLDITDDTNLMNITKGNPGLKPSFTNNLSLSWSNYLQETNTSMAVNWRYATTSNSIASKVTYDDLTGARVTQRENVNGNWNMNGDATFSTSLDSKKAWNISSYSVYRYNHQVSYVTVNRNSSSQLNNTNNTTLEERLTGSFHNSWLHWDVNGRVVYSHVRNMLMPNADRDTYQFSYGTSVNIKLPWEMDINTSVNQNMRRGYNDASANTNELIWNAQISQSLLAKRRLVITLQIYDILGQQKTFSYNVGDTRLSETHYNSITQYAMLHVIYRFRSFGGRAANQMRRERRASYFEQGEGEKWGGRGEGWGGRGERRGFDGGRGGYGGGRGR